MSKPRLMGRTERHFRLVCIAARPSLRRLCGDWLKDATFQDLAGSPDAFEAFVVQSKGDWRIVVAIEEVTERQVTLMVEEQRVTGDDYETLNGTSITLDRGFLNAHLLIESIIEKFHQRLDRLVLKGE